nr:LysR family transcriptional regulator [Alkalimarinus sediminis]
MPLSLTPAGQDFLQSARQISQILKATKDRCNDIHSQAQNRLSFATSQTLYLNFYKSWLKPFCDDAGIDIELNLNSTAWNSAQFNQALAQNQCDLMLRYWHPSIEPAASKELDGQRHMTVAHEVLLPCSAVLESKKPKYSLPGGSKTPIPYIDYHEDSMLRPVIQSFLQEKLPTPHLQTVNRNFHSVSVKAMIKEGFGIGWLPSRLVNDNLKYGKIQRAGDGEWNIPVEVRLYCLENNPNPNLDRFWTSLTRFLNSEKSPNITDLSSKKRQ